MNRLQTIFFAVAVVFILFIFQNNLTRLVWQYYGIAYPAYLLNRSDADLAMQIGNYYFNGGAYNLDKAEKSFKKALEIKEGILWGHYQLARIYFIKGDFIRALSEINKELGTNPSNQRSFDIRALINGYAKNFPEAASDFEEFLKWKDKSWAAHNDLAWIYFQTGDYKKTEEIARRGLKWNPDNPWLLNSLGIALLNLGDKSEARRALESALKQSEKLTPADWQNAYPGNSPLIAEEALKKMIENIKLNLSLAVYK